MASGGWQGSARRAGLPTNWPRLRNSVLKRDARQCRIQGPYCITVATEVDHIAGHSDDPVNLRAACKPCYAQRSARQGAGASAAARRARAGARRRPPEPHPGIVG